MRDPRGVASNFPAAAKFMDRRGVADPGPAQPKPRRLKPEHIVSCQIGKHEITGQRPAQGAINDERGRGDRIPFVSYAYRTIEQALWPFVSSRNI